jgi:phage-related minor tail protein
VHLSFSGKAGEIMADESTSVGKIQLDIEISKSSISREMEGISKAFSSGIKNSFGNIGNQMTGFVKNTIDSMANRFKSFAQVGSDSSKQVSQSVEEMNSQYKKTQTEILKIQEELTKLDAQRDSIINNYKDMPAFSGMSKDESLEQMLKSNTQFQKLTDGIDRLTAKMNSLNTENKKSEQSMNDLGQSINNSNREFKKSETAAKKTGRSFKLLGDQASKSSSKVGGFAAIINRSFMTILRRLFVYQLMYKALRNMISYMSGALKTNKQFVSSLNVIKTSLRVAFQPIYDFILPALNVLMQGIAKVTTYIAAAISALFGKTYKQSYDSAKGIETAKKAMEGYGGAAKKAKGALAGFDEINQLDTKKDDKDSGGGAGEFEMEMPDTSNIDLLGLEKFKELLQPTIDSLKNLGLALEPLKNFAAQGLRDFYNEFLVPVGQWTLGEGLPRLIDGLTKIVSGVDWGYLNSSLKDLWTSLAPFATNIGEGLLGFYEQVLVPIGTWVLGEGLSRFIDAITNGLAQINWEPIHAGLNNLWSALTPFAINVGEGLLWFWENVLVPIGTWTMNEIVPRFLDTLSEAIRILNGVIEALKPLGQWLWDSLLQPLAEWTAGVIVSVLDGIKNALKGIGDWIKDNQTAVENMAIAIGSFMAAWVIVDLAVKIGGIVSALVTFITTGGLATGVTTAFGAAVAFLTSPITIAIAIIGSLIAVGVLLYKNWDEISAWLKKIWEDIKKKAEEIWNGLAEFFKKTWDSIKKNIEEIWNAIATFFTNIWNSIKTKAEEIWKGLTTFLDNTWNNIKTKATTIFNNIKDTISNIFNAIKTTSSNIWNGITSGLTNAFNSIYNGAVNIFNKMSNFIKGITDGIAGFFKGMVNGVIKALNFMTNGLNKLNVDIPDWVPGIGGKSLGFNIPNIPELARGGIVDQPTLAMVGERGKEAVVPLENTAFVDTLASALGNAVMAAMQMGNISQSSGEGGDTILQIDGMTIGRILGPILDKEKGRIGNTIIQPI